MFRFTGRLGQKQFGFAVVIRLILLAAAILGYRMLLTALMAMLGASQTPNLVAGRLYSLIGYGYLMPAACALFVLSFVGVSLRRSRDADLPAWIGLVVPMLFAADYLRLKLFDGAADWVLMTTGDAPGFDFLRNTVVALGCTAALAALPRREKTSGTKDRYDLAIVAVAGCALLFATLNTLDDLFSRLILSLWWRPSWLRGLPLPTTVDLLLALGWIVWLRNDTDRSLHAGNDRTKSIGVAAAAAATVAAFAINYWPQMWPPGASPVTLLLNVVVPTFFMYFAAIMGGILAWKRRTANYATLLMVTLIPFAAFGVAHGLEIAAHAREVAEIAAIKTHPPDQLPETLVIEAGPIDNSGIVQSAWRAPKLTRIIIKNGSTLTGYNRPTASTSDTADVTIPPAYLLLKFGAATAISKQPAMQWKYFGAAGGPLELRFIAPGHNDLVAVWYQEVSRRPTMMPILSVNGWLRSPDKSSPGQFSANIGSFLERALGASPTIH